jgi:hypothetical protein
MIPLLCRVVKQITGSVNKDVHSVVPAVVVVAHNWAVVVTSEVLRIYKGRLVHLLEVGEAPNAIEDENLQFSFVSARDDQAKEV